MALIILGVAIFLCIRVFTRPVRPPRRPPNVQALSNGTHSFQPTVLIISLDGFRPDYIDIGVTPNMHRLREEGVAPEYMEPSFPSVTFPNVRNSTPNAESNNIALHHIDRIVSREPRCYWKVTARVCAFLMLVSIGTPSKRKNSTSATRTSRCRVCGGRGLRADWLNQYGSPPRSKDSSPQYTCGPDQKR